MKKVQNHGDIGGVTTAAGDARYEPHNSPSETHETTSLFNTVFSCHLHPDGGGASHKKSRLEHPPR
ncbi:hypothetical protein EYF80_001593 [Liparis tanakae]|uniref:Uncharacterized protein n=1 Tax=Liparis tanakae TaxID=230148 RepID=A0A4Z2JFH5_9TELE|nr:hypothetical protein EYF80_001593 [Liparis tanakae]